MWAFRLLMLALVAGVLSTAHGAYSLNLTDEKAFFRSIAKVESEGANSAVGDRHLRYRAYGAYQIRYPYLKDVNRLAARDVMLTWGRPLVPRDMHDPLKAEWAMRVYLSHYGARYQRLTGQRPTAAIYARIHQGGPNGWRNRRTLVYWIKLKVHYSDV